MKKVKNREKYVYPILDVLLNGFNYGFHIFTSWYLVKESYAALNAYLALISLVMVIGIGLQNYSAKVTSGVDLSTNRINLVNPFLITGIPVIMLFVLSPILLPFLKGNYLSLSIISAILVLHSIISIGRGLMQGQGDYFKLNISFYIEVIIKTVVLIVLLPVFSTVEMPLISIMAGYVFALFHLKRYTGSIPNLEVRWIKLKTFFKDHTVLVFILSQFCIYSYFSVDMIIVNGLHGSFAPLYAVLQKLGMIQFFVGSSLMAVFLPELSDIRISDREFNKRWKICLLVLSAVLLLFQIFYNTLFPFILPYLFGEQYKEAYPWISYAGVIFALLVIINFLITTLLAKGRSGFLTILFFGVVIIVFGIVLASNIKQVLITEIVTYSAVVFALYLVTKKEIKKVNIDIGKSKKKTILFLSWRDIKSPKKGGAEIYTHEMLARMDKGDYRIIHFSPMFDNGKEEEIIDDVIYYRSGSIFSVILKAKRFYNSNRDNIDYVVNQCNTHRFFTRFWVENDKRIFFIHQLTRRIWFYHAPFPFSLIGYLLEKPLLKLNRHDVAITVSSSTKNDLINVGFKSSNIGVMPEGLSFSPWEQSELKVKEKSPTFIYVGRFAEYKGIDDTLKAFSEVKKSYPDSKIWIVGKPNIKYIEKKLNPICKAGSLSVSFNDYDADVIYKGYVEEDIKLELMSRAHLLVFPSIREGWGLTISEAAAVGTPSLVYDAPGTRDAVLNGEGGYMVSIGDIQGLKREMIDSFESKEKYEEIRIKAYEFSKSLHWDYTGKMFTKFCNERL